MAFMLNWNINNGKNKNDELRMRRYFRFVSDTSVYVDIQSTTTQNKFTRSEKCPRIRINIFEKEILFFPSIWPE